MHTADQAFLERLLERLRELESLCAPEHERPIHEIARASLLEAIAELSHRLHDTDYYLHSDPRAAGEAG